MIVVVAVVTIDVDTPYVFRRLYSSLARITSILQTLKPSNPQSFIPSVLQYSAVTAINSSMYMERYVHVRVHVVCSI